MLPVGATPAWIRLLSYSTNGCEPPQLPYVYTPLQDGNNKPVPKGTLRHIDRVNESHTAGALHAKWRVG